MAHPRSEQETVLTYNVEEGKWYIFTEYPPHIRKYYDLVENPMTTRDEYGFTSLKGTLTSATVSVRKKRELTEEERAILSERAKRNLQGGTQQ